MSSPLHINLKPSNYTLALLIGVSSGAMYCLWMSNIPSWLQACAQLTIVVYLLYLLFYKQWYFNCCGITGIYYHPDGHWYLLQPNGELTAVKLVQSNVLMKYCIILHVIDEIWNQHYYVLLCPDNFETNILPPLRRILHPFMSN